MIDTRNPSNPVLVGSYDTPGWACGVAVLGNYVYVADYAWGLQILRVGEPMPPIWSAATLSTNGFEATLTVSVRGNYRVEWSEDLVWWRSLRTLTNVLGSVRVVDASVLSAPRRFYRAVKE
ncbi:MAG: hypothetical protein RMH97_03925 [Verrucomicrobiales bacterium]|nr:hypothetical protein [Verrucomicrobiales bacterium]